jgi:hypothetical protein
MNVLERIQALLARAASSELEEARTSAWAAAKLIREHKIVLRLPTDVEPVRPQPATPNPVQTPTPQNPFPGFVDIFNTVSDLFMVICPECRLKRLAKDMANDNECVSCFNAKKNRRRTAPTQQVHPRWRRIETSHAGICGVCGNRIPMNVEAFHRRGDGLRHISCHERSRSER